MTLELTHDATAEDSLQSRLGPASNPESLLPRLQEVLRQTALMLNELLRHFWASFPAKSRARLEKLERVHQGLVQQYDKCAPIFFDNTCDKKCSHNSITTRYHISEIHNIALLYTRCILCWLR